MKANNVTVKTMSKLSDLSTYLWISNQSFTEHPFQKQWIEELVFHGLTCKVIDRSLFVSNVPEKHYKTIFHRDFIYLFSKKIPKTAKLSRFVGFWVMLLKSLVVRADIIIADLPGSLTIAIIHKLLFRSKVIYHPYELYGEQSSRVLRLFKFYEKLLLKYFVDQIITQNQCRRDYYIDVKKYCGPVGIVKNVKKPFSVAPSSKPTKSHSMPFDEDKKIFVHGGALIPGRYLEELALFFSTLQEKRNWVLLIVGRANPWFKAKVYKKFIANSPNIHFKDFMPASDLAVLQKKAVCGFILNDKKHLNNMYCAPGKISDFIHAELPFITLQYPSLLEIIDNKMPVIAIKSLSNKDLMEACVRAVQMRENPSEIIDGFARLKQNFNFDTELSALKKILKSVERETV